MKANEMKVIKCPLDSNKEANISVMQKICEMPKEYIKRFQPTEMTYVDDNEETLDANNELNDALDDMFSSIKI